MSMGRPRKRSTCWKNLYDWRRARRRNSTWRWLCQVESREDDRVRATELFGHVARGDHRELRSQRSRLLFRGYLAVREFDSARRLLDAIPEERFRGACFSPSTAGSLSMPVM